MELPHQLCTERPRHAECNCMNIPVVVLSLGFNLSYHATMLMHVLKGAGTRRHTLPAGWHLVAITTELRIYSPCSFLNCIFLPSLLMYKQPPHTHTTISRFNQFSSILVNFTLIKCPISFCCHYWLEESYMLVHFAAAVWFLVKTKPNKQTKKTPAPSYRQQADKILTIW